jgi:hypothetical protein
MTTREAWNEVGDQLSALGLKLKMHLKEELSEVEDDSMWERVRDSFEEVFDALGDASRDPAVRDDLRGVAEAFAAAANTTVDEIRAAIKKD